MTGTVLSVERCSLHDGPGLRTTVFLKGCPLTCLWCHNPESQSFKPELYFLHEKCTRCGACAALCENHLLTENTHTPTRENCTACGRCVEQCPHSALEIKGIPMTVQEAMVTVLKDLRYYKSSGGGLTVSGGEPLAQYDFTHALLRAAKESGVHTCLETAGHAPTAKVTALCPHVDLFLFDYKASDDETHKKFTGVPQTLIRKNLCALNEAGAQIILRCPVIPTFNDTPAHFAAIAETANALCRIIEINIMPYHPMGASKAVRIGQVYHMPDLSFPEDEQVARWVAAIAQGTNIPVKRG